ncbi:MAG: phage holin family protein [Crocinitomicaceae bacterium]|nr:phage holin family protein [Crocinitomicaceae bacterium]
MEDTERTTLHDITDNIKEYVETRYELLSLKSADKVSKIGSSLGMALVLALLTVFFLMFLSIAGGIYLSILLDSFILGFLSLAGFYLILILIFYSVRKNLIINPIRNLLIREMFEDKVFEDKEI